MDKNTIYGLILMALVFAGFMWLSPKPENGGDTGASSRASAETEQPALLPDSLSGQEKEWLAANIRSNGEPVSLPGGGVGSRLSDPAMQLTLAGDSISGTVYVDGNAYDYRELTDASSSIPAGVRRQAFETVRQASTRVGKFGKFARFLEGKKKVVSLENDVLALSISSLSGSITRAELKKYDTEYSSDETKKEKRKVVMFEDGSNTFNFDLPTAQPLQSADLYFTPTVVNDTTVRMTLDIAPGSYWGFEYILPKGENYVVKARVIQKNMQNVVSSNNRILGLTWRQDLRRQEQGRWFEERQSGLYYKFAGGSVENLSEAKNDSEERQAKVSWIAFKNQFFSTVVVPSRPFNNADLESEVLKQNDILKKFTATATVNDYDWKTDSPVEFSIFIGPNSYPLLSGLDKQIAYGEDLKLTRLIPLGWSIFRWINTGVIIPIFDFLGRFISNYGIVILILTIFIKLVLFPLTYKSYKSQAVMRILAPDIKKINEKYPGQEQALKRQQETMALYSKAGASPMSGCLPMLLQMPILFAMFTFFPSCIELRGQSFLWAHDLAAPDAIISWSGNIPLVTEYFGNHISLFCLLMTATNIVYIYINTQSQANAMPGMKWMMYLMPVFFMVFFNNYAAGLSYYYFLSLLITIIQTYAIRACVKESDVRRKMAENAKKPKKKSGFMARLEEMQRQQQQMLKEQQKQRGR